MADSIVLEDLFKYGRLIELQKGEVLHSDHDECRALGKVVNGRLRLSRPLSSGREILLKEFNPGEIFAELIVFTGEHYPGWLIASEASAVIEVNFEYVLEHLRNRDALISFITGISAKMNHLANKIEVMSLKTVRQKIAFILLSDSLIDEFSVTEVAGSIGCSREALSRALSELEAGRMIVREGKGLRITNMRALEALFE